MKKILMTMVAAFAAVSMNAQVYVGGSVGFVSAKMGGGDSESTYKIIPEIGYNLNDQWAVGIALGYQKGTCNFGNLDFNPGKTEVFSVNPYARYTFLKSDMVNLFVDGGLDYVHTDVAGDKTNSFAIGLKPGVAVNLNDKLSFVAHAGFLGYKNEKADHEGAKAFNTFGFDLDGSDLSFGFYYNF